jgi:geranylgeranyl diphosphate synthase, type I
MGCVAITLAEAVPLPGPGDSGAPPDLEPRSRAAGLRHTEPVTATDQRRPDAAVAAHADLARVRDAVTAALEDFLARQRGVLAAMDASLEVVVDELCELAGGGKRLRPLFAYWGWRGGLAGSGEPAEDDGAVLRAVAALEFVHASALVHDDVMDGAATRRGRPATHVGFAARHGDDGLAGDKELFGTGAAILVGDLALVWSDELLRCSGISVPALIRARSVWDTMRTEVTAGQYLDLLRAGGGLPGPEGATKVARYKSAGYTVQRPLLLGAALAGADELVRRAYTAIGLPLGEAFQLRDDVLGVFGDPAVTGKSCDDDLREGKQTLLVALAEQRADDEGRRLLHDALGNPAAGPEQFDALRALMRSTGALHRVEERIAEQTARARGAIEGAPIADDARAALHALAVAATTRTA